MAAYHLDPTTPYTITNDVLDSTRDVIYASLTAIDDCLVKFWLERNTVRYLFELVYIGRGASHSWWTASGGKFFPPEFPHGLEFGDTLYIETSGACAFRIDWYQ